MIRWIKAAGYRKSRLKTWLRETWCDWFHRAEQVRLPMYKQGTYEQVGIMLVCKKCIKGG